ncbi:MAG: bile acid:sodium symporter family protein [Parasphingorhabdus sp.]
MGDFYLANEYWFAVFQLVTAMLGMGATLTPRDFREVLVEPKAVTSGTAIQLLLVPLVALAFISAFGIAGGVAVGIALIAAIPGGTTSNIFTFFARGNVPLSITITAVTTLACLFTTPLILEFLITQYMPDDFTMPRAQIMMEIALTLLLPLVIGMLYLRFLPGTAATFSKWVVRASLFGILMIVVGSASSGRLDVAAFGLSNVALIAGLIVTLGLASWLMGKALRLRNADRTAIDIEVVVRNVNLGFMLKASLFPAVIGQPDPIGDMVLLTLLLYGTLQLLIAVGLIMRGRRDNPIVAGVNS